MYYPFILKIEYWDDCAEPWKLAHTNVLVYAEDMTAAVAQVEHANYFSSMEEISVSFAGDEGTLFEVPGHIADILLAGSGHFKYGLSQIKSAKVADKLRADALKAEEGLEGKSV